MTAPVVSVLPDADALAAAAAAYVAESSAAAVAARGRFTIALSGGSTPRKLYERLSAEPWSGQIAWDRWHVFWSDDRLVPADHADSNVGLAQRYLLSRVPIPASQVHPTPVAAGDPAAVAQAYEAELRSAFGLAPGEWPRFDLILLGLGSDGHTASLFPDKPALQEQQRLVVATPPGVLPPPVDRVTFTFPVLNAARAVAFLAAGADKREPLKRVLAGDTEPPAARVQPTDGELRWMLDTAATAR